MSKLSFDNGEIQAYNDDAAGVLDSAINTISFIVLSIGYLKGHGLDIDEVSDGLCDILMDVELKLGCIRERIS